MDQNGILTIAANEEAETLTVAATSVLPPAMSGTAAVAITRVTGVTINTGDSIIEVYKGSGRSLTASMEGINNLPQEVTWSVEGADNPQTRFTGSQLVVADNENAASITVKATSTANTGISGTAVIHIRRVTGVTIDAEDVTVYKGRDRNFSAAVEGINSPSQLVSRSIESTASTGTRFSGSRSAIQRFAGV